MTAGDFDGNGASDFVVSNSAEGITRVFYDFAYQRTDGEVTLRSYGETTDINIGGETVTVYGNDGEIAAPAGDGGGIWGA